MSAASLRRAIAQMQGRGRGKNGALSNSQVAALLKQHGIKLGNGQKPTAKARRAAR